MLRRFILPLVLSLSASNIAIATPAKITYTEPSSITADTATKTKINFSPVFVLLSDAMTATQNNDTKTALAQLSKLETSFHQLTKHLPSTDLIFVLDAITKAKINPNTDTLNQLSVALYALEKQTNPVDYTAERTTFKRKVMPAFEQLWQASTQFNGTDTTNLRQSYDNFNRTWAANERVVRNTSQGHYGKIETAMSLIRVSIESTPPNHQQIIDQLAILKQNLDGFNAGESKKAQLSTATLDEGIALLQDGLTAFESNDIKTAQAKLNEFLTIWPSIEGDVSTRNPKLYNDIESQIPIITAHGDTTINQNKLASLISQLKTIDSTQAYSWVDAMLVLLREGLEALLIIMALILALTASATHTNRQNITKGKIAVFLGVILGMSSSVLGAYLLTAYLPSVGSGASREAMEGVIGIIAVVFMIGIGAWLHSKSSVQSWNAFITKHTKKALSTGGLLSLFGLAFLSVFREGAETILFYAGILPNISTANFLTGIGLAVLLLVVAGIIMLKTSIRLPIPTLFRILTWVIYALGFKMLGVSILALQLTNHITQTILRLPAISAIGFYPSIQGIIAQALYIIVIIAMNYYIKKRP
ncbi:FTR1 family iron permease [Moraxella nasovis]|uniref:FTR1 family iron permease n=1 Tax=Moraxella nasovis TaxID=2904121 RepID=UPI001F6190D9|nr:FTR1 family protein [Moraxella nasovis]UNU73451.1 FTR1 family iron permease [Moraxella nasovis]